MKRFCKAVLMLIAMLEVAVPCSDGVADTGGNITGASGSQVVTITDAGLSPTVLKIKADDSSVFFFNDTSGSLVTLEVEFGEKPTHCSSTNLKIEGGGKIASVKPVLPSDFASTCFHEAGKYPVKVFGVNGNKSVFTGEVIVE